MREDMNSNRIREDEVYRPHWEMPIPAKMGNADLARLLDNKYRGRYMVKWSWWTQTFLAWPTWPTGKGKTVESRDPQELEHRMNEQEKRLGVVHWNEHLGDGGHAQASQ